MAQPTAASLSLSLSCPRLSVEKRAARKKQTKQELLPLFCQISESLETSNGLQRYCSCELRAALRAVSPFCGFRSAKVCVSLELLVVQLVVTTIVFPQDRHPSLFFTVYSPNMSNVELGVQTEKAFQKQPIFQNSKAARKTTRDRRWYKDVGLGFKTPRAAIDGTYIGKHLDNKKRSVQHAAQFRLGVQTRAVSDRSAIDIYITTVRID